MAKQTKEARVFSGRLQQLKKALAEPPAWLKANAELTPNQRRFLAAFSITGTLIGAGRASGLDRSDHYTWLEQSVAYAEAYALAKEISIEALENEARRRAVQGTYEPVYQGGELVGEKIIYSNTLLMFLLNGERPQKYKQRLEHTGPGGGPLQTVNHTGIDLSTVADDELDKELKRLAQLTDGINSATD